MKKGLRAVVLGFALTIAGVVAFPGEALAGSITTVTRIYNVPVTVTKKCPTSGKLYQERVYIRVPVTTTTIRY